MCSGAVKEYEFGLGGVKVLEVHTYVRQNLGEIELQQPDILIRVRQGGGILTNLILASLIV